MMPAMDRNERIPTFAVQSNGKQCLGISCLLSFTCPKCGKKQNHAGVYGKIGGGDSHQLSQCACWPNGYFIREVEPGAKGCGQEVVAEWLTLAEHKALADELAVIHDNLTTITGVLGRVYRGHFSDLAPVVEKICDDLVIHMHLRFVAEYPEMATARDMYRQRNQSDYEKPAFVREFASTGTPAPNMEPARSAPVS